MHQPNRRRSILDDLKYLPASNPSDQSPPTPTTSTDAPIHPNVSPPSNLPEASTSPSVDEHLPTTSPILPCSPGPQQEPSTMNLLYHHLIPGFHHRHPIQRLHCNHLMLHRTPLQSTYDVLPESENPHNGKLLVTSYILY